MNTMANHSGASSNAQKAENPSVREMIQPAQLAAMAADIGLYARRIKQDIDTKGIAIVPNFFSPAGMARMRETVEKSREICLGRPVRKPLIGAELDGTVFADLASSDFVQNIANPIVRAFGYYVERPDVYPVLNLLQGANSRDAINHFHFDATFLTLAVPVFMPELTTAQRGSFLLWPNVRQFSTSRLLEKLFWRLMKTPWLRDRFRRETVDFSPGSLYFFYGF